MPASPWRGCAVEADGVTWHHLITIEQAEAERIGEPAIVVAECPEHPSGPPRLALADLTLWKRVT